MDTLTYLWQSATVFLIGLVPFLEIYVAIPAGLAMGLDPISTFTWATIGNCLPLALVPRFNDWVHKHDRLGRWIDRFINKKWEERFNRWGKGALLIFTPWVGVWATAVSATAVRVKPYVIVFWGTLSIILYGIGTVLIGVGVMSFFSAE
jgi:uncharacterized membrane protein